MGLRFILGRAGAGKTEFCLRQINRELRHSPLGNPIIFIVPEQVSFHTEYAIANSEGLKGSLRADVLSFRRLAWRVLQEVGGATRVPIGELGKRMLLRRLLEQHKEELTAFARSVDRPGFADTLARCIGELKIYGISPDDLAEALQEIQQSGGLLLPKIQDMSLLYEKFSAHLAGRYTDPDDYLTLLVERLNVSAMVTGAEVWIDGFTGFTPQEFDVIDQLLLRSARVNVALCLEPRLAETELSESDMFYPTWETYRELVRRAQRLKIPIEQPCRIEPEAAPRFNGTMLGHIEQAFFRYPTKEYPALEGDSKNLPLCIIAGVNRRAETETVARKLITLSRDQGFRWRDAAVLLRDIEPYRDLITDIFGDYDIPFFIDCKRNMMHHPLVEFIRSSLECVIKDWLYEPLFRCLKTDLLPLTRDETDRLENYVLAHGIRGSAKWSEEWRFGKRYSLDEETELGDNETLELAQINLARQKVYDAFGVYTSEMQDSSCVQDRTAALYNLMDRLEVPQSLERWAVEAEQTGNLLLMKEHLQVWAAVVGLFDEMNETIGGQELGTEEYQAVLDAGLESLQLGLIPPGLDQVMVGSMDRSRHANVKALFIMGANEGVLPARQGDDGVFSEAERGRLAEAGIVLAPGGRRKAFDEQYLIYMALTRARELLWVSYTMADEEGRAMLPSSVVKRLKEICPGTSEVLAEIEPKVDEANIDSLVVGKGLLTNLVSALREFKKGREIDPLWWEVYNWSTTAPGIKELAEKIYGSLFYINEEKKVAHGIARNLYGQPLRASVSRIERFHACPFAHFAAYGLKLKERKMFRLAAPDMGDFFHGALKRFTEVLAENKQDWGQISSSECREVTAQVVEELAPRLQSEILLSTARYRYLTGKLQRTVNRAALVLAEHARRSNFRPIGVELSFGPGGNLPPVEITLSDGGRLELIGRIDRVDAGQIGGQDYLRVIDYKSSDHKLALTEVYHGLRIQLITYLHVALNHSARLIGKPGLPGAVLYFTVKEPLITALGPMSPEAVDKEMLRRLKMQGLLLGDVDVVKAMDSEIQTGWSELLPLGINKDGNFYANSQVAEPTQFAALRSYLEELFSRAGEDIQRGIVDINPFKYKSLTACTFCIFKPLCRFDLLFEGNCFRSLAELTSDEVWAYLMRREGER